MWPRWVHNLATSRLGFPIILGVSENRGNTPKWMVKITENPIKMDDLGGKPTIFGNIHIEKFTSWSHSFSLMNNCISTFLLGIWRERRSTTPGRKLTRLPFCAFSESLGPRQMLKKKTSTENLANWQAVI